ncbi:MAG TPA: hypothetical protein PLV59_00485 [Candidatus Dojkabacteria bacterium]|nr:hypothetical protein [Candidatus Dojkabacteria bacterium]
MLKLPNLEKSAQLLVEVSHDRLVSKLVYTDYTIGRHYVLSDSTSPLPLSLDSKFIRTYLDSLSKMWDWQLFRPHSDEVMPLANEGFGLDGLNFYIDGRYYNKKDMLETIRGVSKDISILSIDNNYIQDLLIGIANKLGYEDVLLLDVDLENTYIYRLRRDIVTRKLNETHSGGYSFKHGKVELGNDWRVIDVVDSPRVKAFLQYETPSARLGNMWANYILGEKKFSSSPVLRDLVRSVSTLQTLTIRNDHKGDFDGVGDMKYSTLLLVTGDVISQLEFSELLLSVIDGLELNDSVDMVVDSTLSLYTLGKIYAEGIAKAGFLAEFADFASRYDHLLLPDVAKSGERKRVIFSADIRDDRGGEKSVYALSDEISQIVLSTDFEAAEITGKFIKDSSLYSEFDYNLILGKKKYKSIIIDSRYRPIVYGPDAKSNHIKMREWFNVSII